MTDSATLSTDTDGTTESDNTWENLLFLWHISRTEISTHLNLKNGPRGPRNLISISLCFIVMKQCKNEGATISKNMQFAICTPQVSSKFLKQDVSNNMHFRSVRFVFHMVFRMLTL